MALTAPLVSANELLAARIAIAAGSEEGRLLLTQTEGGRALIARVLSSKQARSGQLNLNS
jgi:hypothetical protein